MKKLRSFFSRIVRRLRGPSYHELIELLEEWACDRVPETLIDCDLMIALWRYHGDRKKPCPGCDGDCGEDCAPTKAKAAIEALKRRKSLIRLEPIRKYGAKAIPVR